MLSYVQKTLIWIVFERRKPIFHILWCVCLKQENVLKRTNVSFDSPSIFGGQGCPKIYCCTYWKWCCFITSSASCSVTAHSLTNRHWKRWAPPFTKYFFCCLCVCLSGWLFFLTNVKINPGKSVYWFLLVISIHWLQRSDYHCVGPIKSGFYSAPLDGPSQTK